MVVQLYPEESPITVDNFLMYVNDGHYDGTLFHRVVDDGTIGVVQGGGYDSSLDRLETEDPIVNESNNGLQNLRGTIAMARTSQANSATDQFYFNTTDNPTLDFNFQTRTQGYAVFGEIVFGLDVLDVIRQQPTENRGSGFADIPVDDIFILRARELSPDE
jgi:cyclophilin family peptidyl-prolyl cis-trans isomerase